MRSIHSIRWIPLIIVIFLLLSQSHAQVGGDLIWENAADSSINAISPVGDVNGDLIPDVFIGSDDERVYCYSGADGSIIWSWNTNLDIYTVATISDMNGDGVDDCLAGGDSDTLYCFSGKPDDGLTEILWSYGFGANVWSVVSVSDIDGDGIDDCFVGTQMDSVYCISGQWGHRIWAFPTISDALVVSTIPDVDGDGKDDCLVGGHGDYVWCLSSATGNSIWYYYMATSVLTLSSIEDVNSDGKADCLAGGMDEEIYCLSGGSSGQVTTPIWTFKTGAWIETVSSIEDVNGDGIADCLGGGWSDYIYCISGASSGLVTSPIWSYPVSQTLLSVSLITDVNDDGTDDCIAGDANNKISCIDGNDGTLIWSYSTGGTVNCVASLSDVTGNSFDDVVGGSDDSWISVSEGGTSTETVSTPTTPTGPSSGTVGQSLSFSTGGATSNLGHTVEYRFDWGDGSFSSWGSASQSHTFIDVETVSVKSQARCATHTGVLSSWSSGKSVTLYGYVLTVTTDGSGTVTKDPDKTEYNHNESVDLTATPSGGYQFDHWSGALSGSDPTESITMDGNKSVTAYFTETPETISTPTTPAGSSTGTVGQNLSYSTGGATSNLGHSVEYRFDWGDGSFSSWGSSTQSHTYTNVNTVIIKAQARCTTHTGIVSTWSSGKTVALSGHTLIVTIDGSGTITKDPDKTQYNHNESVDLTATPSGGYQFDHWSGALSGSDPTESVTMDGNKSVTAYFTETPETISTPTTPAGSSTGTVGQNLSYSTGGATSNLGHSIEYRFDWGDGSFSSWGSSSQSHNYSNVETVSVKSQARCATHTGVLSSWSSGKSVTLSGHTLTVTIDGSGTVTKDPDKTEYNHNESVDLNATPSGGYQFDHWSGALSGSDPTESITMSENKSVTAHFTETEETISTPTTPSGPSSGTVGQSLSFATGGATSNLGHTVEYRFDWGDGSFSSWGSSSQSHTYSNVETVTVKSQARCATHTGVLSSWSSGKSVTLSGHTLTVTIDGSGTVIKDLDKTEYDHNESVDLTATPSGGYQFDHWSGALSGSDPTESITMSENKSVTAHFTETDETISTPTTPTGPSSGTVGQSLSFSTGGATSNLGHSLEYRFDWGDGNTSAWGSNTQSYFWSSDGYYLITAQARCATHTSIESEWSSTKLITINPTGIEIIEDNHIPDSFQLSQNFPNPFNPETSITFQLPYACDIHLDVFNIHGEHITTLVSGSTPPGSFEVHWNAKNDFGHPVPSGFYMYRLQTEHFTSTKKMLLLK